MEAGVANLAGWRIGGTSQKERGLLAMPGGEALHTPGEPQLSPPLPSHLTRVGEGRGEVEDGEEDPGL